DYQISRSGEEAALRGITMHRFPIRDHGVPSDINAIGHLVGDILDWARRGATVLIHCIGGLGRSGTLAGCVLVPNGAAPAAALAALSTLRGAACPETPAQRAFVVRYASAAHGDH